MLNQLQSLFLLEKEMKAHCLQLMQRSIHASCFTICQVPINPFSQSPCQPETVVLQYPCPT